MNSAFLLLAIVVAAICAGGLVAVYGARGQRKRGADSHVLPPQPAETALDHIFSESASRQPDATGLRIISDDLEAFRIRLMLARDAGRSLDLQYYYWKSDTTGKTLWRELIAAADRGVRVRLLLDDINAFGFDSSYLALDAHPNIAVRLFNPARSRTGMIRRGIELVFRYVSATRRMHNKSWIADGRVAVIGGRNIGDAYFGASSGANFMDVDMLLSGRAVGDANRIFDSYWNSASALPIRALHRVRRGNIAKLTLRLDRHCASPAVRSYLAHVAAQPGADQPLDANHLEWIADAEVIADPAEKAMMTGHEHWIANRIVEIIRAGRSELIIASPYFIPGNEGLKLFSRMSGHGSHIRVLTNSLAATDVLMVHSAYSRYRRALLGHGISLYEQKPSQGRNRISIFGSRTASLHTKALVADRNIGFVGSFNLDPRSASINTEMGVVFRSATLADSLAHILEQQIAGAYELAPAGTSLRWYEPFSDMDAGSTFRNWYGHEPMARPGRRLASWLARFLPIESQL